MARPYGDMFTSFPKYKSFTYHWETSIAMFAQQQVMSPVWKLIAQAAVFMPPAVRAANGVSASRCDRALVARVFATTLEWSKNGANNWQTSQTHGLRFPIYCARMNPTARCNHYKISRVCHPNLALMISYGKSYGSLMISPPFLAPDLTKFSEAIEIEVTVLLLGMVLPSRLEILGKDDVAIVPHRLPWGCCETLTPFPQGLL